MADREELPKVPVDVPPPTVQAPLAGVVCSGCGRVFSFIVGTVICACGKQVDAPPLANPFAGWMHRTQGGGHWWADFLEARRRAIGVLADEGKSYQEIARILSCDEGQVHLIHPSNGAGA
jgi:hypothetical protein